VACDDAFPTIFEGVVLLRATSISSTASANAELFRFSCSMRMIEAGQEAVQCVERFKPRWLKVAISETSAGATCRTEDEVGSTRTTGLGATDGGPAIRR
jgi:hypothetical protein